LLLAGAKPDTLLAITFTRKAAAEMQSRLNERLLAMASCDDNELRLLLNQIEAPVNQATIALARRLFETVLHNVHPIRITTFHAFCQDLLKRFPFEASVPPGFELIEQTSALHREALDLLFSDANRETDGPIAHALETLFDYGSGLTNTQLVLHNFIKHRSDWWAYTLGQTDPVTFAIECLRKQLGLDTTQIDATQVDATHIATRIDLTAEFFTPELEQHLREFAELLTKNPTASNVGFAESIELALVQIKHEQHRNAFEHIYPVFFNKDDSPRSRKSSKVQARTMGESGETRFLKLHDYFCTQLNAICEQLRKHTILKVSSAWYVAGSCALAHYQNLKNEQRILDFADLEWYAYLLLTHKQHATWVQYKLDARIDHILIDEFQDTNPTQWQLLLPVLQELASSATANQRSVFLVGDAKQSIYRFRRAQPGLLDIAQHWLNQHMQSKDSTLNSSRRSSPAIIEFVNQIFGSGKLHEQIVHFEPHQTHLQKLWGYVRVVPLFDNPINVNNSNPASESVTAALRNPLLTPRIVEQDERHVREAGFIAEEITRLVTASTMIGADDNARVITFNDIIILLRHRTHAASYQKVLTERGIPFVGINKGTLLDTLEIRDMVALLSLLITPFNNLAVAQILKSPVFDCTDEDLIALAGIKDGYWIKRLHTLSQQGNNPKIERAYRLLSDWKACVNSLPVHDLLDKIFCESNLIERYVAAYPDHLTHRVESNLSRFMELALDIDSGRYPSVGKFLSRLQTLQASEEDAPDELPPGRSEQRVRIMTIHAAKGLEAPVIFLADAANASRAKITYQAFVNWPAHLNSPSGVFLIPKKSDVDQDTQTIITGQNADILREEANLLYVAVTRSKQILYITGVQPTKLDSQLDWYHLILAQLQDPSHDIDKLAKHGWSIERNSMPGGAASVDQPRLKPMPAISSELSAPLALPILSRHVTPSTSLHGPGSNQDSNQQFQNSGPETDNNPQQRGMIIHHMLQRITEGVDTAEILPQLSSSHTDSVTDNELRSYLEEAVSLTNNPALEYIFNPNRYVSAYNEVPIQFQYTSSMIHGVVDRIVETQDVIYLIDYKTTLSTHGETQQHIANNYVYQLSLYHYGISLLWPGKKIRAQIIFTRNARVIDMNIVPIEDAAAALYTTVT